MTEGRPMDLSMTEERRRIAHALLDAVLVTDEEDDGAATGLALSAIRGAESVDVQLASLGVLLRAVALTSRVSGTDRELVVSGLRELLDLGPMPMSITCPRCGMTSHNPNDVKEGYCGNCHDWTS